MGMMTGTSCDAIDAVVVRFEKENFSLIRSGSLAYPRSLRERVLEFQAQGSAHDMATLLKLQKDLGVWYAKCAQRFLKTFACPVDVIGNHGQTVAHFPGLGTLQLGEPSWIAAATGKTVVSDFRSGDFAAGGQGAPLVPRFHVLLMRERSLLSEGCSIHNLGGISNLTYAHRTHRVLAWDTGPANLWIDAAVAMKSSGRMKFDRGGRLAAAGSVDLSRVEKLLRDPYFDLPPPKSTGRDHFRIEKLETILDDLSPEDAAATATFATAMSIARAYKKQILERRLPLRRIFFCGGGANNPVLLGQIEDLLNPGRTQIIVDTTRSLGVDPQDMEAAAFAFLTRESLAGNALGGSWTGARAFGPPGKISPAENWPLLVQKLTQFSATQ
jgi:anhydro-N-acetylmuramic acid kinase